MKIEVSSVLNVYFLCLCVISELSVSEFQNILLSLKILTALNDE